MVIDLFGNGAKVTVPRWGMVIDLFGNGAKVTVPRWGMSPPSKGVYPESFAATSACATNVGHVLSSAYPF